MSLPVSELARSRAFIAALGSSFKRQLTADRAACLVISDNIVAMLVVETRDQVDASADAALAAGASASKATDDQGFM